MRVRVVDEWRRAIELEESHPDLAYVLRQAAENNVGVLVAFGNLGEATAESCGDYLRAADDAVEIGILQPDERDELRRRFWHWMRSYE